MITNMTAPMSIESICLATTICLILVIVFATIRFHLKFTPVSANKGPALLTTIGILGTFLGIALGLLELNPDKITECLPDLIAGITTAFWASTVGIFGAITIKVREILYISRSNTITDNQQGDATTDTVNSVAALLLNIKNALVGNDDSTLLGQIKLARQESNDQMNALRKSLDSFCEKIADNNSKALIDALQEVIKDFNAKINEQFGENFKHLNQAVGKTLEWQEQYRLQISEMIDQQTQASNNMVRVSDSMGIATEKYSNLMNQAEIFNTISSNLSGLLATLSGSISTIEVQRHQIDESVRSLAVLINTASDGLPKIEENILAITDQLSKSVEATGDKFNTSLMDNINNSTFEIAKEIKFITTQLSDAIAESSNDMKGAILNAIQSTNNEVNANLQHVNQQVSTNITSIIANTKEQIVALDKGLELELNKALAGLGNQLAALSGKFAYDYAPLTDRLSELMDGLVKALARMLDRVE